MRLLRTASGCSLLQSDEEGGPDGGGEDGRQKFIAHVPVPSQQEVGRWARRALLWVPPVPAGSSDSRGAGDHAQFRVWVQGRQESIHLRAVACPAVHGGSLWLTCAGKRCRGKWTPPQPRLCRPQIEEALVRRKKMELLQKYTSETLQAQSEEARRLLGC